MSFNSTLVRKATLTTSFLLPLIGVSCVPNYGNDAGSMRGGSHLSQIQMKLPATDALTTADGKKPIDALRIVITPVDVTCANGTHIDDIIATQTAPTLQKKIAKGCDYDLKIELGKMDPAGGSALQEIYYAPTTATRISAEMTKDDKISVRASLQLTDAGKAIGLPATLPAPSPQPNPQPQPQPQPQPLPQPTPPSLTDLPAKLAFSLDGPSGPVNFANVFTTQYMILDFSQVGCFYCTELAKKNENDSDFQRLISGSKCRAATILPNGQVSDWIDATGGPNTHGAKETYSYKGGHSGMGKIFGISISGTPTVIVLDRTGQIVDQKVGAMPGQISTLCGN